MSAKDSTISLELLGDNDVDYVAAFQQLASLHLKIQRVGPRADLLLRRAWIETALGDFGAACETAKQAADVSPGNPEPLLIEGEAELRRLLTIKGLLVPGPGYATAPRGGFLRLLGRAREAFTGALAKSPTDQEIRQRVELMDSFGQCDGSAEQLHEIMAGGANAAEV